jgi:hypothetical protein
MLAETLSYHAAQISQILALARSHVEQLVLVCGGSWQDRRALLQIIATEHGLTYTTIGLRFAKALLGQPPRERSLAVMEMLENLSSTADPGLALDNIEILFDPELHLDPLRAVQSLARRRLVLLSWPGERLTTKLVYARPDHSEYRTYPIDNLLVYSLENFR